MVVQHAEAAPPLTVKPTGEPGVIAGSVLSGTDHTALSQYPIPAGEGSDLCRSSISGH